MIGLTILEFYISIFIVTEEKNDFEFYTDSSDEISFFKLKHKVAEALGLSEISPEGLEYEIYGPDIIKIYEKLSIGKIQTDGYYTLFLRYARSTFRHFESYLRILIGLNEDDIQLLLKQYNSKFITHKISPGNCTFEDLSEVLSRSFRKLFEITDQIRPNHKYDKSGSINIDIDNMTLISKLVSRYEVYALRFDEKSFFNKILGFSQYWDYQSCENECYSEKNRDLGTIKQILLKCRCINGSFNIGVQQPILYSFV